MMMKLQNYFSLVQKQGLAVSNSFIGTHDDRASKKGCNYRRNIRTVIRGIIRGIQRLT